MGKMRKKYTQSFIRENLKERGHLADFGLNGMIILKWILEEYDGRLWTGFI
jgi:hypothetical protein